MNWCVGLGASLWYLESEGRGLSLEETYGSLPTWDVLWFMIPTQRVCSMVTAAALWVSRGCNPCVHNVGGSPCLEDSNPTDNNPGCTSWVLEDCKDWRRQQCSIWRWCVRGNQHQRTALYSSVPLIGLANSAAKLSPRPGVLQCSLAFVPLSNLDDFNMQDSICNKKEINSVLYSYWQVFPSLPLSMWTIAAPALLLTL